jgi:hypothetical protein
MLFFTYLVIFFHKVNAFVVARFVHVSFDLTAVRFCDANETKMTKVTTFGNKMYYV